MSSFALLVDSTSFSLRSLARWRSSWTAVCNNTSHGHYSWSIKKSTRINTDIKLMLSNETTRFYTYWPPKIISKIWLSSCKYVFFFKYKNQFITTWVCKTIWKNKQLAYILLLHWSIVLIILLVSIFLPPITANDFIYNLAARQNEMFCNMFRVSVASSNRL